MHLLPLQLNSFQLFYYEHLLFLIMVSVVQDISLAHRRTYLSWRVSDHNIDLVRLQYLTPILTLSSFSFVQLHSKLLQQYLLLLSIHQSIL